MEEKNLFSISTNFEIEKTSLFFIIQEMYSSIIPSVPFENV